MCSWLPGAPRDGYGSPNRGGAGLTGLSPEAAGGKDSGGPALLRERAVLRGQRQTIPGPRAGDLSAPRPGSFVPSSGGKGLSVCGLMRAGRAGKPRRALPTVPASCPPASPVGGASPSWKTQMGFGLGAQLLGPLPTQCWANWGASLVDMPGGPGPIGGAKVLLFRLCQEEKVGQSGSQLGRSRRRAGAPCPRVYTHHEAGLRVALEDKADPAGGDTLREGERVLSFGAEGSHAFNLVLQTMPGRGAPPLGCKWCRRRTCQSVTRRGSQPPNPGGGGRYRPASLRPHEETVPII